MIRRRIDWSGRYQQLLKILVNKVDVSATICLRESGRSIFECLHPSVKMRMAVATDSDTMFAIKISLAPRGHRLYYALGIAFISYLILVIILRASALRVCVGVCKWPRIWHCVISFYLIINCHDKWHMQNRLIGSWHYCI